MDIETYALLKKKIQDIASPSANKVSYDNSDSGLEATNVKDALDELSTKIGLKIETVSELPIVGEENVLYIVPKATPEEGNYSDEYTWNETEQDYDKVGDTLVNPLPAVTSSDNGKLLGVVNSAWDKVKNPNDNIASAYDATSTYAVGDLVIYNNNLYECNTTISVAEAWDSTHWMNTNVIESVLNNEPPYIFDAKKPSQQATNFLLQNGKTNLDVKNAILSNKAGFAIVRIFQSSGTRISNNLIAFSAPSAIEVLYLIFYQDNIQYYLGDISNSNIVSKGKVDYILPTVSSSDNGKFLGVSSGAWTKVNSPLPSATSSNANNILNVNSIGNYQLIKPYIVNFNVGVANGICSFYDGKKPSDVYAIMYGNGVHAICFLTLYSGADNIKYLQCKFNSSNNLVAYNFYDEDGDLYYEEYVWNNQSSSDSSSHTKHKINELTTTTASDEGKVAMVDSSGAWTAAALPTELPSTTSSDAGKALIVDSNGDWGKANIPVELPTVSSVDNGKVLGVVNGTWGAATFEGTGSVVYTLTNSGGNFYLPGSITVADIKVQIDNGKSVYLNYDSNIYHLMAYNELYMQFLCISPQSGAVAGIIGYYTNNYFTRDSINHFNGYICYTMANISSADAGKVLTVNGSGRWYPITPTKELPAVAAADNGKVLTVNNGAWVATALPNNDFNINVDYYTISSTASILNTTVSDIITAKNQGKNIILNVNVYNRDPEEPIGGGYFAFSASKEMIPVTAVDTDLENIHFLQTTVSYYDNAYSGNLVFYTFSINLDDTTQNIVTCFVKRIS